MDTLRKSDLQQLIEAPGKWRISLYMPTHRAGREQQQDPIRFRNLLNRAQKELTDYGLRMPEVQALMRPTEELLLDHGFWQTRQDGLAVFMSDGFFVRYRLPARFEEMLLISNRFHIKPLLPLLSGDGKFYVLSLSKNKVSLYLATRDSISEINLPDSMADNMQDALRIDSAGKELGFHTGTSNSHAGERGAMFYGQTIEEDEKRNILNFFHQVDNGLKTLIEDENIPMVPACVSYLLPIYLEANTHKGLLKECIGGNPEREDLRELHRLAWEKVEPIFAANQREARDRFEQLNGQQSELAVTDVKTAVKASYFGTIATLFIPLGVQNWGRYDPVKHKVHLESESKPENEDLLDLAAIQTILSSGEVYAVEPELLPGDGELAAILRYPLAV